MQVLQTISGKVIHGISKGREIGFPTLNIETGDVNLSFGVYISKVQTPLGVYKGALHYGPRMVLDMMEPSLEVHLLDFTGDLYGQDVTIEILEKVRDTWKFPDFASLQKQITLDVSAVRDYQYS